LEDTEFYKDPLVLPDHWRAGKVTLDLAARRVDVCVEEAAGVKWSYPECGKGAATLFNPGHMACWG